MPLLGIYKGLPLSVVKGEGFYLYTQDGRRLIDMVSGLGVNLLGYGHPAIRKVFEEENDILHLSNLYSNPVKEKVSEKLERLTGLDFTFFTNSGTEGVEAAMKFAWKKRPGKIIAFEGSFHGRTLGSWNVSQLLRDQDFPQLKTEISFVPFNDPDGLLTEGKDASICIFEPIQGSGGVKVLEEEMVCALKELQNKGVILIADEVQSGMGRTGYFLSSQALGIEPDIVVLAKGLGGGLPLGAVLLKKEIADAVQKGDHGSTMGGNLLALKLSLVVLEILEKGLMEEVRQKGNYIFEQYGEGFDLRGKGLFIGIKTDIKNGVSKLLEKGFVVSVVRNNVVRILPPFIIDISAIDRFFDALQEVCLEGG